MTPGSATDHQQPPIPADLLDLAERAEPGPFRPRTRELGTYLGIRENGALAPGRSVPVRSRRA